MLLPRVIPCLLLKNGGLVKTVKFKDPTYVGDPINAVKIFNEKEVDELFVLDIFASREGKEPNFELLKDVASQAFMPMAYGGGLRTQEHIQTVFSIGYEKIVINTTAAQNPELVTWTSKKYGAQAVVGSIDVKKSFLGKYESYSKGGTHSTGHAPEALAKRFVELGAGEILINSIDRDGTMSGYDLELIRKVSSSVEVPIVAVGGAGALEDFKAAIQKGGASAVSAGSLFVFHGKFRAVLISYPSRKNLEDLFETPDR